MILGYQSLPCCLFMFVRSHHIKTISLVFLVNNVLSIQLICLCLVSYYVLLVVQLDLFQLAHSMSHRFVYSLFITFCVALSRSFSFPAFLPPQLYRVFLDQFIWFRFSTLASLKLAAFFQTLTLLHVMFTLFEIWKFYYQTFNMLNPSFCLHFGPAHNMQNMTHHQQTQTFIPINNHKKPRSTEQKAKSTKKR